MATTRQYLERFRGDIVDLVGNARLAGEVLEKIAQLIEEEFVPMILEQVKDEAIAGCLKLAQRFAEVFDPENVKTEEDN